MPMQFYELKLIVLLSRTHIFSMYQRKNIMYIMADMRKHFLQIVKFVLFCFLRLADVSHCNNLDHVVIPTNIHSFDITII